MSSYYKNFDSIKSIDNIRAIFPDGEANELNWCLFSTSGVHGTYTTIEDIEKFFSDESKFVEEENGGEPYFPKLTVLIIMPRIVSMLYGKITVSKEDIPYLRKLATSSVESIAKSQSGNLNK